MPKTDEIMGAYIRASPNKPATASQRLDVEKAAEVNDWKVLYYEDVASGAKDYRPGLTKLEEDARAGKIDTIILVRLDRLGRRVLNTLKFINEMTECGVSIKTLDGTVDTSDDNPLRKVILTLMAAFAEMERDLLIERTNAGLERAKSEGKTLGRKVNPPDKATILAIKAMLGEGASKASIRRALGIGRHKLERYLNDTGISIERKVVTDGV